MRRNERHFSYIFRIRNKSHQNIGQYLNHNVLIGNYMP